MMNDIKTNSEYQKVVSIELISLFKKNKVNLIPNVHVGNFKIIDLATTDLECGIEIKSGVGDLCSGCGLNQEKCKYGYVIVPNNQTVIERCIGHLYLKNFFRTGVIARNDNGQYCMVKKAEINPAYIEHISEVYIDSDPVGKIWREENADG